MQKNLYKPRNNILKYFKFGGETDTLHDFCVLIIFSVLEFVKHIFYDYCHVWMVEKRWQTFVNSVNSIEFYPIHLKKGNSLKAGK